MTDTTICHLADATILIYAVPRPSTDAFRFQNTRGVVLDLILIILSCGALLASAQVYGWWQ